VLPTKPVVGRKRAYRTAARVDRQTLYGGKPCGVADCSLLERLHHRG